MRLTLLWLSVIDTRLHCVLVVHSSKSTVPDLIPWWDPWNASQLTTDVPAEPLPASRTQTLNPDVEIDFTHSTAGSWILICLLPWLRVTKTLTSPEPWNWVLNETDWQPWLFWEVSVILTFPAWKTSIKINIGNRWSIFFPNLIRQKCWNLNEVGYNRCLLANFTLVLRKYMQRKLICSPKNFCCYAFSKMILTRMDSLTFTRLKRWT